MNPKRRENGQSNEYVHILGALEDGEAYTPASIGQFAKSRGLLQSSDPDEEKLEMHGMMILLGRLAREHRFPMDGDTSVTRHGQAPAPGWFGWRWKG